MSENAAGTALGWSRGVFSATLRRIDGGGGVNTATLTELEKLLGRPAQWILTGEEPSGVRLRDCPGWAEAAAQARERYGLTDEQIAHAGAATFPKSPRYVDAALIRSIADAI